jgi:hypothetical protein
VFVHTSRCKAISQTTLMLPHWQQNLALVQPTSCSIANRCWCMAAFSVSSVASLVRSMPHDPFSRCQKRQACTSVLQQSSLTLHVTMTTSMLVDHSCFQQATSWMRQYIATTDTQLAGGVQPLQSQLFHYQQASRQLCSVDVQLARHRALGTGAL